MSSKSASAWCPSASLALSTTTRIISSARSSFSSAMTGRRFCTRTSKSRATSRCLMARQAWNYASSLESTTVANPKTSKSIEGSSGARSGSTGTKIRTTRRVQQPLCDQSQLTIRRTAGISGNVSVWCEATVRRLTLRLPMRSRWSV